VTPPVQRPFGSPTSPSHALDQDAAALAPSFRIVDRPSATRVRLFSEDPEMPDIQLSLVKERRLFSRSWPLVVGASVEGVGPPTPATLSLHRPRLRGSPSLRTQPADDEDWARRFEEAGMVTGASTMTGIRTLQMTWRPNARTWGLRLETLAGALIGTAPGSAIVVGLEPEDVAGLFHILRAFLAGATRP
jgi:hypothetical protein